MSGFDLPGEELFKDGSFNLPLGSKIETKKLVLTSGGGGSNASVTFARQRWDTAFLSVVGNDTNGQDVLNELKREGVDISGVERLDGRATPYSVILVQDGGERTILTFRGDISFQSINISENNLSAKWLLLDSVGGDFDLFEKVINIGVKNNIKLVTNPDMKELGHGMDQLKPLLKNFSIVILNQDEAAKLVGIESEKEDEIFKAMDEVVDGIVVMTKGPAGVAVSDGEHIYKAGIPDSPVIERTGAGDAFTSGFVSEYMRSADISRSIQLATANASSVVTQYGGKAGILKKDDLGPWPLVEVFKK